MKELPAKELQPTHVLDGKLLILKTDKNNKPYFVDAATKQRAATAGTQPQPLDSADVVASIVAPVAPIVAPEDETDPFLDLDDPLPAFPDFAEDFRFGPNDEVIPLLPFSALQVGLIYGAFREMHREALGNTARRINETEVELWVSQEQGGAKRYRVTIEDEIRLPAREVTEE